VAVLGLSYKANLKVSTLSPIIDFCKFMKKNKKVVNLFDPYFNNEETLKITNCKKINKFPTSLKNYDCVVFAVGHSFFIKNKNKILKNLNCKIFFDNTGHFSNNEKYLNSKNIKYKLAGSNQWL
jgi:UDP-N-acetyl-D-mannosaminuronate dehydrogenase